MMTHELHHKVCTTAVRRYMKLCTSSEDFCGHIECCSQSTQRIICLTIECHPNYDVLDN